MTYPELLNPEKKSTRESVKTTYMQIKQDPKKKASSDSDTAVATSHYSSNICVFPPPIN